MKNLQATIFLCLLGLANSSYSAVPGDLNASPYSRDLLRLTNDAAWRNALGTGSGGSGAPLNGTNTWTGPSNKFNNPVYLGSNVLFNGLVYSNNSSGYQQMFPTTSNTMSLGNQLYPLAGVYSLQFVARTNTKPTGATAPATTTRWFPFTSVTDGKVFYFPAFGDGTAQVVSPTTNDLLTDLVSWWTMDEEGGVRNDSHGTNVFSEANTVDFGTGVITNSAVFWTTNSSYFTITDDDSVFSSGTFSAGAWVNYTNTNFRLFSKADSWILDVESGGGGNLALFGAGINSPMIFAAPTPEIWNFIAVTCDGTNASIYVNATNMYTAAWTVASTTATNDFLMGTSGDGAVDEVFYYKRALTQDEITALYNNGLGKSYPPNQ